tara:strand:+ start:94 stop:294 length:201 start_codon:yes stop_codon:yes gene_type:complete
MNLKLRTMQQAADHLGLKMPTLKNHYYNISNQTAPAATKLGKRIFFTEDSLDNFVKSNTVNSENEV